MELGDLVTIDDGVPRFIYKDIFGHHRIYVGVFKTKSLGVCLDTGFSNTDMYYLKIFVDEMIGWIKPEGISIV